MNTLWRTLGGLCAAILVLAMPLGFAVAPVQAEACTELLIDGGFETGAGWQLGPSPVMPQYVTYTRHSGYKSLSLGITSGANVESFSSARQTVTIPASSPQVLLSFWFYAMADSPATTDYMEVVLLDATGSAILNKPWRSHNDSRVWNQLTFDLTPWRGQTIQLYFNVYNDGVGGRAALFLDDASLASCTGGATVAPTGAATATATGSAATSTPTPSPTPGCVDVVVDGEFDDGLAKWQVVGDPAGAAPVSTPARSTPYALKLGSQDQNLNGLTTVRQLVTIPTGYPQVTLDMWVYTQTQTGAGADYQQVALLDASGGLLYMPWQRQENNPAWQPLTYNVSAFAGQTVFVSFSVNNDGIGGRTAMHVDDVRLRACSPGAAGTPTTTGTPPPTATPTVPAATLTAVPPGCIKITQNEGFEAGYHPWQVGGGLLPPQIVNHHVFNGAYVMQLGTQKDNRSAYSSIRQKVTAPLGRPRVVVSFWAYTWAEALSGADRQQFILLGSGGEVWTVPWSKLEDEGIWQQHIFDIVGAAGQSFSLYFNVINDGAGGRTALFLDEVHAWACTPGAYPPELESASMATGPEPVETLPSTGLGRALAEAPAATPAGELTRIALEAPASSFVGTPRPSAEAVTAPGLFTDAAADAGVLTRILSWLSNAVKRLPPAGFLIIGIIVAVLIYILIRARPRP